jgi:hypothetical protein
LGSSVEKAGLSWPALEAPPQVGPARPIIEKTAAAETKLAILANCLFTVVLPGLNCRFTAKPGSVAGGNRNEGRVHGGVRGNSRAFGDSVA